MAGCIRGKIEYLKTKWKRCDLVSVFGMEAYLAVPSLWGQRIQSSFASCAINRLNRQSFSQYPHRASYLGLHTNQKALARRHNLLAVGAIRAVGLGSSRRPLIGSSVKLIPLR